MEAKKTKELRFRIKKMCSSPSRDGNAIASGSVSPPPTGQVLLQDTAGTVNKNNQPSATAPNEELQPSTNTHHLGSSTSSTSESESDDFTTIHFKAAALEASAAHASGLSIDWQRMKSVLISGAKSVFKAKDTSSTTTTIIISSADGKDSDVDACQSTSKLKDKAITQIQSPATDAAMPGTPVVNVTESVPTVCISEPTISNSKPTSSNSEPTVGNSEAKSMALGPQDDSSFCSSSDNDAEEERIFTSPCTPLLSKLTVGFESQEAEASGLSLFEDDQPIVTLAKILDRATFNPLDAKIMELPFAFKNIVSLSQLSLRENNEIEVEIKKSSIVEYSTSKKDRTLSPFMDVSNIHVKHSEEEFFTFCSCKSCLKYREIVVQIMVEQFKAAHMVIMLLDVLIRAYGPMLKNETAYNKFDRLLDANKDVHWITCGFLYNKKMDQMDFIYDESLSENMILVLFSSILMVNNPLLLLQVLAFHMECIMKAYAEGFLEIVEPDNNKIPAEEMLTYILEGYDDLCRISEEISTYFFAFEKYFLNRLSLTWSLLCQRLYQQHVFMNLTDTMLACIITLKEEELTTRHATLIRKYIQFDERMSFVDRCWTRAWIELNKFNLTAMERKRRKSQLSVYNIFNTVVQDAIAFSLQEGDDDHDFYDFECLQNRRLAWQNIMAYTKMKWPDGFFNPPNTVVCDDKCKKCNVLLEYHADGCKCITCSIGGGPMPPKRTDSTCYKCLAHQHDKDRYFYESLILNVCASDDFLSFIKNNRQRKTTLEELGLELSDTLPMLSEGNTIMGDCIDVDADGSYHLSWAVFKHLSNRRRYRQTTIEERVFCRDCRLPACLLARKILNDQVSPGLAAYLVQYFQPVALSIAELRSVLPNMLVYNRRMRCSPHTSQSIADDFLVKVYWTFIVSLYATYFMDLTEDGPLSLESLELAGNDIRLMNVGSLCKSKASYADWHNDDEEFLQFLIKIKDLSPAASSMPPESIFSLEFQKKLDDFFAYYKKPPSSTEATLAATSNAADVPMEGSVEANVKKTSREKVKKCCFDHADMGEHCKENHTGKKRIKKECNHARINETRDRLRKKLTQLVNARKNIKPTEEPRPIIHHAVTVQQQVSCSNVKQQQASCSSVKQQQASCSSVKQQQASCSSVKQQQASCSSVKQQQVPCSSVKQQQVPCSSVKQQQVSCSSVNQQQVSCSNVKQQQVPCSSVKQQQVSCSNLKQQQVSCSNVKQPLTLKSAASAAAAANAMAKTTGECSDNCAASGATDEHDSLECLNSLCKRFSHLQATMSSMPAAGATADPVSSKPASAAATSNATSAGKKQAPLQAATKDSVPSVKSSINIAAPLSSTNGCSDRKTPAACAAAKAFEEDTNSLNEVSDLYDLIDYCPKDRSKVKKWINETLSFIEGGSACATNGKKQPQTTNPKKAAKKAKQKMRKEEEKRISELQDLRWQFHDIYFKEFTDKHSLKALKLCKKRDKKRIAELEANVKKLQRAKAKIETAILELIATVKQTSADFKFTYLPTKEQQLQKLQEIEASAEGADPSQSPRNATPPMNGLTTGGSSTLPFAHAQEFPYQLDFQAQTAAARGNIGHSPMPTPICYAPAQPQHPQQLAPDVVAAMAANAACHTTMDQSKRIVTIRRINLPNVPEPQVTVTAKGSSPDKDKLLYTFVNGQLVPTNGEPVNATPPANVEATREAVFRLPLPPQTKTQKKKERRMLAKQAGEKSSEAEAAAVQEAEQHERERLRQLAESAPMKIMDNRGHSGKKKQKHAVKEHIELEATPPLTMSKQKRLNVLATPSESCSADTSASGTPISSHMNTRDNSVSSLQHNVVQKATQKQPQQKQEKKLKKLPAASTPPNHPPALAATKGAPKSTEMKAEVAAVAKTQKKNTNRSQLTNDNQFHNNPYNSLHLHDSDIDWSQSSSDNEAYDGDEVTAVGTSTVMAASETKSFSKPLVISKSETPSASAAEAAFARNNTKHMLKPPSAKEPAANLQQTKKSKLKTKVEEPKVQSNAKPARNKPVMAERASAQVERQPPTLKQQQAVRGAHTTAPQQQSAKGFAEAQNRKQGNRSAVSSKRDERSGFAANTSVAPEKRQVGQPQQRGGGQRNQPPVVAATADSNAQSKRVQKQVQRRQQKQEGDYSGGIPHHMGYFNADDVAMPSPLMSSTQHDPRAPYSLAQHLQHLHIGNSQQVAHNAATQSPNVSIMDQLNRGVQVENLSLPPGITLTKVDPAKSEQLRQKSESIKKLSKPLLPLPAPTHPPPYHHQHHHPTTIMTPPVAPASGYYGVPYAGVAAAAAAMEHANGSGIIMVEAHPPKPRPTNVSVSAAAAAATALGAPGKTSKNKKRRTKGKSSTESSPRTPKGTSKAGLADAGSAEMITLRNPMFHSGPAGAAASILQQQSSFLPSRQVSGLSLPVPPVDQPAAIIKNENGMFTIRNPALHQAVTNGLTLGGYRQFGNVNYYTPQEAAVEAVRGTQLSSAAAPSTTPAPFSYFSNVTPASGAAIPLVAGNNDMTAGLGGAGVAHNNNTHNTISISCTSVGGSGGGLTGEAAIIARPTPSPSGKCISAIGSEIKSAQQQKQQQAKECHQQQQQHHQQNQWTNFGQDALVGSMSLSPADNLACAAAFPPATVLQEKYQQSSYYNGYDVFGSSKSGISATVTGQGNSFFDTSSDRHRQQHHSCGDDSPPPSITGYNSYLEGIPNTGVVRYDDATFLKNLIPGQNLNNEVSIHNVNDSNYARNANASPVAHRVEITPVYSNRAPSANMYDQQTLLGDPHQQQGYTPLSSYHDNSMSDFRSDGQLFTPPNNLLNLNNLNGVESAVDSSFPHFNYDFEMGGSGDHANGSSGLIDFSDMLLKKSAHSQRTSPYLDENTLESFVQSMNAIKIGSIAPVNVQCATRALNGGGGGSSNSSSAAGNVNGGCSGSNSSGVGGTQSTSSNSGGWW